MLMLAGPCAQAFELLEVESQRDGDTYLLRIEGRFKAPPERLLAVLTDFDRVHKLHPRMTESRSLGMIEPGVEEVYTRFEGCVLLFCRTVHRVETIRVRAGVLVAEDVAERGSFREGRTEWRFSREGSGTRLQYEARFVPGFWVAPVIGPGVLSRSVERMTIETMSEADRLASRADD